MISLITILVVLWLIWYWLDTRGKRAEKAKVRANEVAKKAKVREALDNQIRKEITEVVNAHLPALHLQRLQTTKQDAYGNVIEDGWLKEKDYFYQHVVRPNLNLMYGMLWEQNKVDWASREKVLTMQTIDALLNNYVTTHASHRVNIENLTPNQFETHCAQLLREDGWKVQTTKLSGDQGIDIIGEKEGWLAVFQVKKYSTPVGNKAVQEVIAGKAFAGADLAFVISNASFTPSAIQLAKTADVKLLHHSQLSGLTDLLDP